jgi:Flp pilus assembly pilin Flp
MKRRPLAALLDDRSGVTALEYALITFFVALAIVGSLNYFSTAANGVFSTISHAL